MGLFSSLKLSTSPPQATQLPAPAQHVLTQTPIAASREPGPCPDCYSRYFWQTRAGIILCRYCQPIVPVFHQLNLVAVDGAWVDELDFLRPKTEPETAEEITARHTLGRPLPPLWDEHRDWWWSQMTPADQAYASTSPHGEACVWCGVRNGHATLCNDLHTAWSAEWPWGKFKGKRVKWIAENHPDYLRYFLTKPDLRPELKAAIQQALAIPVSNAPVMDAEGGTYD